MQDLSAVRLESLRRFCAWQGLPAGGGRRELEECICAAVAPGARVMVDFPDDDAFRQGVVTRTLPPR